MRWDIAGCVDLSLCLTLPLSCMGNIAEQGADVAVPSSPTCLFFPSPTEGIEIKFCVHKS